MTKQPRTNDALHHAVGQLILSSIPGREVDAETRACLKDGTVGAIYLFSHNVESVGQLRELCAALRQAAPAPLLIAADLEGGYVWRLVPPAVHPPSAMACGATGRPDLTEALARASGTEMRALGIDVNLAPVVDVNNNPSNPVIATRSYGATPERVSEHALAAMRGLRAAGVAACAKHFPGHGDTEVDSHLALPAINHPLERLQQVELAPFRAAIAAGVELVMTAHVVFPALDPDLPATLSPAVLTGLLRRDLGFGGVICTDAMNMAAVRERWGSVPAGVRAVQAGADLVCSAGPVSEAVALHRAVMEAVRGGVVDEGQVRASATRVQSLKRRLASTLQPPLSSVGHAAHHAAARAVAEASITRHGPSSAALAAGERVGVIEVYAGPASEAEDRRGLEGALGRAIGQRVPGCTSLLLDLGALDGRLEEAGQLASECHLTIIATRNAWRFESQQRLITAVAGRARRLVHVALRDPYDLRLTPPGASGFAIYCDVPASVEAAAGACLGGNAPGSLPVPLT